MKNNCKLKNNILRRYKETKRSCLLVYFILRILVIACSVRQLLFHNISGFLICILTLTLYTLPTIIQKKTKIEFPNVLESLIYIFIFSAEILGEINNFYGLIPIWDSILHTINGFLWAGVGFSTLNLLNDKSDKINLSPIYLVLVSFCFSMTIGVCWEFFEWSSDRFFNWDMQKDTIVTNISTVELNDNKENKTVIISNIEETTIKTRDGKTYVINGYLDIGLNDTMKDLLVNLIGAIIFDIIAYISIKKDKKDKYIKMYLLTKNEEKL